MTVETKPASLGFEDAFNDMDVTEWKPKPPQNDPKPPVRKKEEAKVIRKVARASGFTSRESIHDKEPEGQINIRAKQRIIDEFRDLGAAQEPKWPSGYVFERALAALKKEIAKG